MQQNSPVHVECQPSKWSGSAQAVSSPIRFPTRNSRGDLEDRRCITCETLHVGLSSNMAHQTTGAGSGRNNHENVQHVNCRGQFSKHIESHDFCPRLKKTLISIRKLWTLISTNFQSDIPVEDSRKGCRDQIRRTCMQNCTGSCLITNLPISPISFIPLYRNSCFNCSQQYIVRTIDSGKWCALVLLDLSAAFDTCWSSDHVTGAARSILL